MPKGIYKRLTLEERFWLKIKKSKNCWEWIGGKFVSGYGRISNKQKSHLAHRISWKIHYGYIPKGLCILHKCDNLPCVRPDHLFLGTNKDNTLDMIRKGRGNVGRGERQHLSKLTEKEIIKIRSLYKKENIIQIELAKIFHTDQANISRIINRKQWKHI